MNVTKAEMLTQLQDKVSLFKIPDFFYFSVADFQQDRERILQKMDFDLGSKIVVRSSTIFEDGSMTSSAGEFDSVLNVDANNKSEILKAIEKVIYSYRHKKSDNNQVIMQEMVKNSIMSGVIFTHELNAGAPYYVINYDDESGATDTVTSGSSSYSNRTLYIHRNATGKLHSKRFIKLLEAIKELESILDSEFLDIEFALGDDMTPYLFQVRPITTKTNWNRNLTKRIDNVLDEVQAFVKERFKPMDGVYGATTVLGQMPDWNPAEMIGRAPRALASSLYKKIITDNTWRIARKKMGYSIPEDQPLMVMLAGQPYIDCRLSFQSFLPKTIPPSMGKKLVDHWVKHLHSSPELHDKIEFDVAITSYCFNFEEKIVSLIGDTLTKSEVEEFKQAHLIHTRGLIKGESEEGSISYAMDLIKSLKKKNNSETPTKISSLPHMLELCQNSGTIPFAILARHGFIAKTILLSLEAIGILSKDDVHVIQSSVQTVASDLVDHMYDLSTGVLDRVSFMKEYGHLRPGTYDITSARYDQMTDFSVDSSFVARENIKLARFDLSESQESKINSILARDGFGEFNANDLISYISEAIIGREYGKFVFTKTLSDILEGIAEFAGENGLSREEVSHIPIDTILSFALSSPELVVEDHLRKASILKAKQNAISSSIRLPQLLVDESGVYIVPFQVSLPNFVTSKKITAETLILSSDIDINSLGGRIIMIEGADPGFDWIFTHKIAGLITKYGGANSHMAIRCAEFDIPAAIGCGEQRYDAMLNSNQVLLDCSAGVLVQIY